MSKVNSVCVFIISIGGNVIADYVGSMGINLPLFSTQVNLYTAASPIHNFPKHKYLHKAQPKSNSTGLVRYPDLSVIPRGGMLLAKPTLLVWRWCGVPHCQTIGFVLV